MAKRLRRYTAKVGAITIPSFFSRRYQDQRNVLSCIAAVVILIFFIPYTASGFKAIGTLFNSLFGVDYHTTMIIGAAVVISYTVLGGFLAVSTTDLIQSIIMTFALILSCNLHPAGRQVGPGVQRLLPAWPERDDPEILTRHQASQFLRRIEYRLHLGLGFGLLRHAPHPAAVHGH